MNPTPKILSADISKDGVMIVFADGKTAIFPAAMRYAALPQIDGVIDGLEEYLDEE